MGTWRVQSWVGIWVSCAVGVGCASEAPRSKGEPKVPDDPWDRISTGPEWLHATQGVSGSHADECKHVMEALRGEKKCSGALCVHGHALARDWLARCKQLVPAGVTEVEAASAEMAKSKDEAPSKCASDHATMVRDGCAAPDRACEAAAQRWATRCGKAEGSPLVVRMLERSVERRRSEPGPVELDTRSCADLLAEVAAGAKCAQRFDCEDALKKVYLRRGRCEANGERPTAVAAALETVILHGAEQPTPPVALEQGSTKIESTPNLVLLAEGTGVLVSLCDARVLDASKVLEQRRACTGGKAVVARLMPASGRDVELRLATVEFPDDRTAERRFPWLAIEGEAATRERDRVAAVNAELERLVKLPGAEAAAALLKLVHEHGGTLRRLEAARAQVQARDAALVPAFAELGKMRLALASRGRLAPNALAVLAARGRTRPFADVGPGGASAPLLDLDASWLPKAMAAHAAAIAPLQRGVRTPTGAAVDEAVEAAAADAATCGRAQQEVTRLQASAMRCAMGSDRCEPAQLAATLAAIEAARAKADAARASMLNARALLAAAGRPEPPNLEADSGCSVPSWW